MPTILYQNRVNSILTSLGTLPTVIPTRSDTEQTMTEESMTLTSIGKYSYTFEDPEKELSYSCEIKDGVTVLDTVEVWGESDLMYNNITEADEYFLSHFWGEEWFTTEPAKQLWVLKEATSRLNALDYAGTKSVSTQLNAFPRDGGVTPQRIKDAHLDITLKLLQGYVPEEEIDKLQVSSNAYAGARTTYTAEQAKKPWITTGIISHDAWVKLIPYFTNSSAIKLSRA